MSGAEISYPFPCDSLEQELDAAAIDAVALHQKDNQGILNQLCERAFCDGVGHDTSPGPEIQIILDKQ